MMDFLRPDLEIFNGAASLQHLSRNLTLIWVFFPSSYLSPSLVSPAVLTRSLSISRASQGKAARPGVDERGLKEGKLQPIGGH